MSRAIFLMIVGIAALWLILDDTTGGKQYVTRFAKYLFPSDSSGTANTSAPVNAMSGTNTRPVGTRPASSSWPGGMQTV